MPGTWPRPSSAISRSSHPSICPSIDPVINAFVHIIAAITAYQINPFKPKLNLQSRYSCKSTA